jgi:hypothetical protein
MSIENLNLRLHDLAMDLADSADELLRRGHVEQAREIYARAADTESRALDMIPLRAARTASWTSGATASCFSTRWRPRTRPIA